MIPLAALAGVLIFIASRLIKIDVLAEDVAREPHRVPLCAISALGVIFIGVEQGIAIAVGLAVLDQTWRSARPHMVVLGRRDGTTSWEPLSQDGRRARRSHDRRALRQRPVLRQRRHVSPRGPRRAGEVSPDAPPRDRRGRDGRDRLHRHDDSLAGRTTTWKRTTITFSFARVSHGVKDELAKSLTQRSVRSPIYDSVDASGRGPRRGLARRQLAKHKVEHAAVSEVLGLGRACRFVAARRT